MKKLDLYIIRKFLGTFFFSMVLILSIVVVFDLSERLEKFIENEAPVKAIIFDYYLNFVPYFANVFSSLFTFISVIFFTSKMAYNSEIIAILSTGISFRRMVRPYMISAGVIACLSLLLSLLFRMPTRSGSSSPSNIFGKSIATRKRIFTGRLHRVFLFICRVLTCILVGVMILPTRYFGRIRWLVN